jgi:hypothetical protein
MVWSAGPQPGDPFAWYSSFALSPRLESLLLAAGLKPHLAEPASLPAASLLVYASPDQALEQGRRREPVAITPAQLLERYQLLTTMADNHRLVSSWRLEQLAPAQITAWMASGALTLSALPPPPRPRPLTAAVVAAVLAHTPACGDAYLQLEAQAERFGMAADTAFLARIREGSPAQPLLEQWWQCEPDAHLPLLQLEQVEEELRVQFQGNLLHRQHLLSLHDLQRQLHALVLRQWVLLSRKVAS